MRVEWKQEPLVGNVFKEEHYSTKREYWGEITPFAVAFGNARQDLRGKKSEYFAYLSDLRSKGVVTSGIYKKGATHHFENNEDWYNYQLHAYLPHNLVDTKTVKDEEQGNVEYSLLPLVKEKEGVYQGYDPRLKKFRPCELKELKDMLPGVDPNDDSRFCSLPEDEGPWCGLKGESMIYYCISRDSELIEDFYEMSLYQQILFALGVDVKNEIIGSSHRLKPAFDEFNNEMQANPLNPWGYKEFSRGNFLQYSIACMLKESAALKQKVKGSLDFCVNYSQFYKKLDSFYYKNGIPIKSDEMDCLPCEEQVIAYYFTDALFKLWASCMSEEGFWGVWELNEDEREQARQGVINIPSSKAVRDGARNYQDGFFLKVWDEVRRNLLVRFPDKKDWLSFSGHGNVLTLDEKWVEVQNKKSRIWGDASDILSSLRIAYIDSAYSGSIMPCYQKEKS